MKKHLPTITIFIIIIGIIALGIWYSDKDSPIKELAKLDVYSKEELSFLEKEGFLNDIDSENLPSNKEQVISLLKSPALIEQNLNSSDESFEVLATKLDENTYQLAFKLENKSNQSKEFYLIPISKSSQTEFKEIKGVVKGGKVNLGSQGDWGYDIEKHKQELRPELAQAYDDIDNNGYTGKPIKLVLNANSTLLAQSKWEISRGPTSDSLKPVYLLVHGSAGGAMDELYKDKSFENLDKVEKVKEGYFKIKYDKYSEVELGSLETDDFEPTAKLKKWGDEAYIKVSYPTFKKIKPKQEDKKLKWKDDKVEIHFYPLEPIEFEENGQTVKQLQNGGFEFEIILKEKPVSNKIVLDIETKGLKFYYQPELTQEQIDRGDFRPENVVGSYAVFHATKGNMHPSKEEADKYKAGKAFHIYRPKITDVEGHWAWESQIIDVEKGKITITIPQDFLDNAVYPVRSTGETFGFEGTGGSTAGYNDYIMGTPYQSGVAGTATSMTFYSNTESDHTWRPVLYKDSDNSRIDWGAEHIHTTNPGWDTENLTQSGSIAASTNYKLGVWLKPETRLYYDSGVTGFFSSETYHATNPAPDPLVPSDWADHKIFIYCTYTPSAAEPTVGIKGSTIRLKGAKVKIK